jgi:hypothetical protein
MAQNRTLSFFGRRNRCCIRTRNRFPFGAIVTELNVLGVITCHYAGRVSRHRYVGAALNAPEGLLFCSWIGVRSSRLILSYNIGCRLPLFQRAGDVKEKGCNENPEHISCIHRRILLYGSGHGDEKPKDAA